MAEVIASVRAVRELIERDIKFIIDANFSMSVDRATEAAIVFNSYDLLWFKEQIISDDYAGFGQIANVTQMLLAVGEYLHIIHEIEHAIKRAKLSFFQLDASNCGGISGWLQGAEMSHRYGIRVCSYRMQDLHVSLPDWEKPRADNHPQS